MVALTIHACTIVKISPRLNGKSSEELPGNLYKATTSVPLCQGIWITQSTQEDTLEKASTHKSVKTLASNVLVTRDLDLWPQNKWVSKTHHWAFLLQVWWSYMHHFLVHQAEKKDRQMAWVIISDVTIIEIKNQDQNRAFLRKIEWNRDQDFWNKCDSIPTPCHPRGTCNWRRSLEVTKWVLHAPPPASPIMPSVEEFTTP